MISGATLFLYLLPLAAAPIVFHLLVRRQRNTILFSTRMFFDRVRPQLTFYQRFREPLLLAARVIMIALLLLALARLLLPGMGDMLGLGGNQAVVVLIDNSGSMSAKVEGDDRDKMKVAVEGARALLTNMDENGRAGVVLLVDDPRAGAAGGMSVDKDMLLEYLETLDVTDATGDPARAARRGLTLLKEASPDGGGSLHIFSDLQETEWEQPALDAEDIEGNVQVFFHRIPTAAAEKPNVCVMSAKTSARRILPNQSYQVEVLLRNDGDSQADIRVNSQASGQPTADVTTVSVPGQEQKTVKLAFRPTSAGRHWIQVWIEGDGFDGDNRAFVSYVCEDKGDIYFVGQQTSDEFGLLPLAISPRGDGRFSSLVPSYVTLDGLAERMEQKKPMLVVLKWSDAHALDDQNGELLEQFVREGGNLLVLPAVAGGKPEVTPPEWLAAAPVKMNLLDEAAPLQVVGRESQFWSNLRGPTGRVSIGNAYVGKFHPLTLKEDAGYVPLLNVDDEQTVLAIRSLDKGQITVSGIAFAGNEGEWSTLPKMRAFLAMTQPIALGAVSSLMNENMTLVAGNPPRALLGKGDDVKITTVLGDRVDWSGPRDQTPTLVRGGAYILGTGKQELCLSVLPSDLEGDTAFVDGGRVVAMGDVPHLVGTLSDEEDFRDELENSVSGMGLFLPFLLLAIGMFLVEGMLGSPSRMRKLRPDADEQQEDWDDTPVQAPASRETQPSVSRNIEKEEVA